MEIKQAKGLKLPPFANVRARGWRLVASGQAAEESHTKTVAASFWERVFGSRTSTANGKCRLVLLWLCGCGDITVASLRADAEVVSVQMRFAWSMLP